MVILDIDMAIADAALGFSALGSEARLAVVLTLVKAGPGGLSVGDIQARSGMAASTLAHHLKFLTSAGLVAQEKNGRTIVNRAAFDHLEALAGYLLKECCVEAGDGTGAVAGNDGTASRAHHHHTSDTGTTERADTKNQT